MSSTRMVMLRSINVNIIQDCLDNQNRDGQGEEDVNMNSANDDTFNNNNN